MDRIKVAIIGQGRSGRDIHAYNLKTIPEKFAITAVVDVLPERRERATRELGKGCCVFADYTELFAVKDDIDLVINATPSHLHVPVTLDLLRRGFNVLCEKPFAKTAAEVDQMITEAEKSGALLAVFQQSRFNPCYKEIMRILDSGILGEIIHISVSHNDFNRRWDWQTVQGFNGGSLYNTGPHPIDQALRMLDYEGMPDVKAYRRCVNTYGDAEDYGKLIITAPSKPVIDIEISSCCAYPEMTFNVHAKWGGLRSDGNGIDYKYYLPAESPERRLTLEPLCQEDGTPSYCVEKLIWHEESWTMPETDANTKNVFESATAEFYQMIYGVMREGGELAITPRQVRQQIAVLEEAHRQAPLEKTVRV